ncbi:MAG: hypothetical protein KC438_02555 [Thermomicrobiales bacterium]|nr:hypothetical protein [Thermomicrobiales bacterium]MCO5220649.1 hypothetical protein [Thermomicrobiales bacterium]
MAIEKRDDVNPDRGEHEYGDVAFADPTNNKYPIDTEEHVRAAWSYIHMPRNASEYDAKDLETIKNRIREAAERYGIELKAD